MNLLLTVVVYTITANDSRGAIGVNFLLKGRVERLMKIIADGAYRGELIEKTKLGYR